ncbi:hypothetical protein DMUE_6131, partial [Dictyocoela muelleri]
MFKKIEVTIPRDDGFVPDYELVSGIENNERYNIDPTINDINWIKEQLSIPFNTIYVQQRESLEAEIDIFGCEYVKNFIKNPEISVRFRESYRERYYNGDDVLSLSKMIRNCFSGYENEMLTIEELFIKMSMSYEFLQYDGEWKSRVRRELNNNGNYQKTVIKINGGYDEVELWSIKLRNGEDEGNIREKNDEQSVTHIQKNTNQDNKNKN